MVVPSSVVFPVVRNYNLYRTGSEPSYAAASCNSYGKDYKLRPNGEPGSDEVKFNALLARMSVNGLMKLGGSMPTSEEVDRLWRGFFIKSAMTEDQRSGMLNRRKAELRKNRRSVDQRSEQDRRVTGWRKKRMSKRKRKKSLEKNQGLKQSSTSKPGEAKVAPDRSPRPRQCKAKVVYAAKHSEDALFPYADVRAPCVKHEVSVR